MSMPTDARSRLHRLLERARRDAGVLAVLLFGSRARGEAAPGSDVDVCLVLADRAPGPAMSETRLACAAEADVDLVVFRPSRVPGPRRA